MLIAGPLMIHPGDTARRIEAGVRHVSAVVPPHQSASRAAQQPRLPVEHVVEGDLLIGQQATPDSYSENFYTSGRYTSAYATPVNDISAPAQRAIAAYQSLALMGQRHASLHRIDEYV